VIASTLFDKKWVKNEEEGKKLKLFYKKSEIGLTKRGGCAIIIKQTEEGRATDLPVWRNRQTPGT
jgi:hypothetical protein